MTMPHGNPVIGPPEGGRDVATVDWEPHLEPHEDMHPHAIPVHVTNKEKPEKFAAADLASWRTITFLGNASDAAQQILSQDPKRHKATINASGNAGNTCVLARSKQVGAGGASGFTLAVGQQVITEAASELWIIPTGQAITVSIAEERYL